MADRVGWLMVRACVAVLVPTGLAAGQDLLVSSRFANAVLRYDANTGAFKGVFASGSGLANPNGIAYGPDGNLYVGMGDTGVVKRFNGQTGAYIDDFVTTTDNGGLNACRAIAFGPAGDLYVNSGTTDQVLRYDGSTGAFAGVFASGHGMSGPVGLTFGPDGTCYVGAALSNAAYVFTSTGSFVRSRSFGTSNSNATGVLLHPDGNLLVAFSVTNRIAKWNLTTNLTSTFATGGGLNIPIGMIWHPSGDLLVGSFGNDKVVRFSPSGALVGDLVLSGSGGLDGTHNFAFMPEVPTPSAAWTPCLSIAMAARRRRR